MDRAPEYATSNNVDVEHCSYHRKLISDSDKNWIELFLKGKSNREIERETGISKRRIRGKLIQIGRSLSVSGREELREALQHLADLGHSER